MYALNFFFKKNLIITFKKKHEMKPTFDIRFIFIVVHILQMKFLGAYQTSLRTPSYSEYDTSRTFKELQKSTKRKIQGTSKCWAYMSNNIALKNEYFFH